MRGDFGDSIENVLLSVDGFSFGTWLSDNPADDEISTPANDIDSAYSILTGTSVISLADFSGLVSDGTLNFFFDYSPNVTDFVQGDTFPDLAQVRVQYEARDFNAVPEPSTIFLFGFGLAGLAAWCYRKHAPKA